MTGKVICQAPGFAAVQMEVNQAGDCGVIRARLHERSKGTGMTMGTLILIVIAVLLVAALPRWPHSRSWGYFPSSMLGVIVIAVLVMVLMGKM
jgi:hypothetical protein